MGVLKLTDWFPWDVKPVHIGWYHTMNWGNGPDESSRNWYWNGHRWLCEPGDFGYVYQKRIWRGLAEEPHTKDEK